MDIGKTKIAAGVVNEYGKIISKKEIQTEIEKGREDILKRCELLVKEIISNSNKPFSGIGIASAGIVDSKKGMIISSGSIPGWSNISIKKIFEKKFLIPVRIDNDVNVAALGEYFFETKKRSLFYLDRYWCRFLFY